MTREQTNIERVKAFFEAARAGAHQSETAAFYSEDVVQEEFPNAFLPNGAKRGLKELQDAAARGRAVMASQVFEFREGEIVAQRNQDCFYPW